MKSKLVRPNSADIMSNTSCCEAAKGYFEVQVVLLRWLPSNGDVYGLTLGIKTIWNVLSVSDHKLDTYVHHLRREHCVFMGCCTADYPTSLALGILRYTVLRHYLFNNDGTCTDTGKNIFTLLLIIIIIIVIIMTSRTSSCSKTIRIAAIIIVTLFFWKNN